MVDSVGLEAPHIHHGRFKARLHALGGRTIATADGRCCDRSWLRAALMKRKMRSTEGNPANVGAEPCARSPSSFLPLCRRRWRGQPQPRRAQAKTPTLPRNETASTSRQIIQSVEVRRLLSAYLHTVEGCVLRCIRFTIHRPNSIRHHVCAVIPVALRVALGEMQNQPNGLQIATLRTVITPNRRVQKRARR